MKIQQYFMKVLSIICLSFLYMVFSCGSDYYEPRTIIPEMFADARPLDQTSEIQPPLADVLAFELSFGADNVPDEFLITRLIGKQDFTVDDEDNVYIYDEYRLKVFDKNCMAKTIIGRPGEGPGEFMSRDALPTVGPQGYITVFNGMYNTFYSVFNPQHKFIYNVNRKPRESGPQYSCKVITIDEDEYISEVIDRHKNDNFMIGTFSLVHTKNEEKDTIASYDVPIQVIIGGDDSSLPNTGDLFWDLLPGGKVIYTHSWQDELNTPEGNFYIIHVYDLDTGERIMYKKLFTPVPMEKRLLLGPRWISGGDSRAEKIRDDYIRNLKIKYAEALRFVFFDGPVMFAYTNTTIKKDKYTDFLVDVIDIENEKYLKSIYLINYIGIKAIKNGYAYMNGNNEDGFPVIEKYRIDPSVYGK
ncbi:hypothetical protein AMJ80_04155 [bacterium SM23_31]|nr:MAG: hypothetical protein AMJ80_04155 [bacterium SM23_31]